MFLHIDQEAQLSLG